MIRDDGLLRVPFPQKPAHNFDKFVMRLIFKPESGTLWGFNEFFCKKDLLHEVNDIK